MSDTTAVEGNGGSNNGSSCIWKIEQFNTGH